MKLSRRDWHKLTFGGLASTVFKLAQQRVDAQSIYNGVLIGMQSYSFRDMSLDEGMGGTVIRGKCGENTLSHVYFPERRMNRFVYVATD